MGGNPPKQIEVGSRETNQVFRRPERWGIIFPRSKPRGMVTQAKRQTQLRYEEGLVCFLARSEPARFRFLPPLAFVTDDQIDLALAILERALLRLVREESKA